MVIYSYNATAKAERLPQVWGCLGVHIKLLSLAQNKQTSETFQDLNRWISLSTQKVPGLRERWVWEVPPVPTSTSVICAPARLPLLCLIHIHGRGWSAVLTVVMSGLAAEQMGRSATWWIFANNRKGVKLNLKETQTQPGGAQQIIKTFTAGERDCHSIIARIQNYSYKMKANQNNALLMLIPAYHNHTGIGIWTGIGLTVI